MLAMNLSGCSFFVKKDSGNTDIQSVRQESENADKTVMKRSKSEEKEAEEILEICSKTYAKAEKEGKLDDLEMIRDLIKELGEKGFTAVDSENQVNMTEYEKLIQFSEKAEAKKNGRMTVVEVAKGGSCIIRNMETHDGIVNMIRSYCIYENGKLKQSSEDIYRTESWEYTEDGHLMFSGRLAFEGSYEVTRNEIMEYMAYRVLSLDETCRELNRKYILPIGYERNNMFQTDWSEEEFAVLDFYDMFDLFYQENHTANGEFTFGNAMGTSAVYLISKEKFEPVIKSKFKISSEVLQSKTVYYPCEEVYEYKPRGLEETEYPEYPYLCNVLRELTGLKQFTDDLKKRQLTVKVMSFAYKKGIPDDSTGNGGGYVFDCRAVNNPGKYERYKPFTGLDEPVITFLEEDGEILRFLDHVYALVDASVQRYMERGFSNLSVCFGCTGGQHRSVYSAQHLAEHLNQKFGVKVELVHREQNIEHTFEATI